MTMTPAARILIVEDEAVVALDLKIQLQGLGYTIVGIASSGESAIEMVDAADPGRAGPPVRAPLPDLILMDVRLQGRLDGVETATAIRAAHDIPVIFLTSHSDDETVRRAAHSAPYGYLTKPYQLKELRAGIEIALTKARLERQLRDADRWFAHTLKCVDDGVIVTDVRSLIRFMNPAAERLTGWPFEEAVGQPFDQVARFKPTPASDDTADAVHTVLQRGRPLPVTHSVTLISRSGQTHWVDRSAGPIDDDHGRRLGAVLVLHDAAERLIQEKRLRASEERFRNAFDHAPLGMALVSLAGDFIQVNTALCELVGGSAEAVKAHGWRMLVCAADRDQEAPRLLELLQPGSGVVQFETRLQRLDGRAPVSVLASVSLTHASGLPSCHLYQLHDLTAQRVAAEKLAELAQERLEHEALELASKANTEFLSRVSHEMRTPLNAVIGFAQLLQMQTQTQTLVRQGEAPSLQSSQITTFAQHIRKAGEHMLALVGDLLDLNRVAEGKLKMQPQPVPLARAVGEALDLLGGLAQAHDVALEVDVGPALTVVADPIRLRQVLLNLVSNAIKYNRQGGWVRVAPASGPEGRIRLQVEDCGIGMTPEQLKRLYQPFDRLGAERTNVAGVGLGLAIAHGLMAEMSGSLVMESRPGEGTKATIELPGAVPA